VSGGGDRKEFCDSFDDSQDDAVENTHVYLGLRLNHEII
jgi:hypothetical protein